MVRPISSPSGLGFASPCPYGVSSTDLDLVRGVREVEGEVLLIATSKAKFLEAEYNRISGKLVGFKFTMDDRRSTAKEDEEKVVSFQADFERASKAVLEYELQVRFIAQVRVGFLNFCSTLMFRVSISLWLEVFLLALTASLVSLCVGYWHFQRLY